MKLTTHLCLACLVFAGLCAGIRALTGFDPLLFLCGGKEILRRVFFSFEGVCALWLIYWFFAFRPTKSLS